MVRISRFLLIGLAPLLFGCTETGSGSLAPVIEDPHFVIESRFPAPGRAGVDVDAWITVGFSSQVDPTTVTDGSIVVNGGLAGRVEVNGFSLHFIPAAPLHSSSTYAIALSPALRGTNGLSLGPTPTWGFKTATGPTPPDDPTIPYGPRPGDAGFDPR
jgi:hypothetical protein